MEITTIPLPQVRITDLRGLRRTTPVHTPTGIPAVHPGQEAIEVVREILREVSLLLPAAVTTAAATHQEAEADQVILQEAAQVTHLEAEAAVAVVQAIHQEAGAAQEVLQEAGLQEADRRMIMSQNI